MNRTIQITVLPAIPAEIRVGDVIAWDAGRTAWETLRVARIDASTFTETTAAGTTRRERYSFTNGEDFSHRDYFGVTMTEADTVWLIACAD